MSFYRDDLISAAQVALNYGSYTFDDALALSRSKRHLLLSVAMVEKDRSLSQLERSLGILWDTQDLVDLTVSKPPSASDNGMPLPRTRIPMLMALASEFIFKQAQAMRGKVSTADAAHVPSGSKVVEVSHMTPEQARAFFNKIGGGIDG